MAQLKTYFLFISFLLSIVFTGCKKETNPDLTGSCLLYSAVSSDTNYIPHKKGNNWNYCNEASSIAWNGWTGEITLDTIIGNKIFFKRTFQFTAGHSGAGVGGTCIADESVNSMIDNLGNYYFLKYRSNYIASPRDTILIIKPSATNGDTLYNDALANVKVVLINKNETFYSIPNCYHSRVILNDYSGNQIKVDHYFKKGIGELYCTENIEKKVGEILSFATIK